MVVYLTELMPARVRASGFSLAYSLATAIFGGFTPAICTYLIQTTGNRAIPGIWLTFAALVGLIAVFLARTAFVSPDEVDDSRSDESLSDQSRSLPASGKSSVTI